MIVVDTSALLEILLAQPRADACDAALQAASGLLISAGTVAEALIVAYARKLGPELDEMLARMAFEIVPVSATAARQSAAAYRRWGKGYHPASLNFGDCFSYTLAMTSGLPLLFVGSDFSQTDVASVLTL